MLSKEEFNTYLGKEACWAIRGGNGNLLTVSPGMESLAESISMKVPTMLALLEESSEGFWPLRLGGGLFTMLSAGMGEGVKLLSLRPSSPEEVRDLLQNVTGEELFALCSSDGRMITVSSRFSRLFGETGSLTEAFDSSSSGAIVSALRKCLLEGSVQEFLVSCSSGGDDGSNYGLSMRRLPSPGKLLFCRLHVTSVAVVTGSMDRNSMIRTLLEESFCPNVTIDAEGVITSMNHVAREISMGKWGSDPTGRVFFELVHPDQREEVRSRHEQRRKGYAVPSRYSIHLTSAEASMPDSVEVSVVSLFGLDRWVIFMRPLPYPSEDGAHSPKPAYGHSSPGEGIPPEEALSDLVRSTGATSAAYVNESEVLTAGDSASLISVIDRGKLATSQGGTLSKGVHHQRIRTPFGTSHLLLETRGEEKPGGSFMEALEYTSRILERHHIETVLEQERKLLSLTREMGLAYLGRKESLDGLLSDFARTTGMETVVVYRIGRTGSFLGGVAGAGVVGTIPDLPLDELNTASWACLRGETALYTGAPGNDLRFTPVFHESQSEIAVPFFRGTTPDGVVLLASSERDHFSRAAGDFIQLLALLFSSREELGEGDDPGLHEESSALRDAALENLIQDMSGLHSAFSARSELLRKDLEERAGDPLGSLSALADAAGSLEFTTRWALWFLRTSLFQGKPRQRWIDPSPLLERTLAEAGRLRSSGSLEMVFEPPASDLEVCTDGSFIGMIAHSLIACVVGNAPECSRITLAIQSRGDHWSFSIDAEGDSVPGECLSVQGLPDQRNMAFLLAWKLTEELGGTVSTFSNRGRSTKIAVRLRKSG